MERGIAAGGARILASRKVKAAESGRVKRGTPERRRERWAKCRLDAKAGRDSIRAQCEALRRCKLARKSALQVAQRCPAGKGFGRAISRDSASLPRGAQPFIRARCTRKKLIKMSKRALVSTHRARGGGGQRRLHLLRVFSSTRCSGVRRDNLRDVLHGNSGEGPRSCLFRASAISGRGARRPKSARRWRAAGRPVRCDLKKRLHFFEPLATCRSGRCGRRLSHLSLPLRLLEQAGRKARGAALLRHRGCGAGGVARRAAPAPLLHSRLRERGSAATALNAAAAVS